MITKCKRCNKPVKTGQGFSQLFKPKKIAGYYHLECSKIAQLEASKKDPIDESGY